MLFQSQDLDKTYTWICKNRQRYGHNNDVWDLRYRWHNIKDDMLEQLNHGTYTFQPLQRYEMDDGHIALWCAKDMMALRMIAIALSHTMHHHIPKTCYHLKGHGGLKKAVHHTQQALKDYKYVLRSDVKGYYESVNFDVLMSIITPYVNDPVLLTLLNKALRRKETSGGNFYDYDDHGITKGSALSPLLGAIALMPLDMAMGQMKDVFYARFMDDWVVLTKTKNALRKVIKMTHKIMGELKFTLHPTKTYIGKISHGFNFLGYFMDDQKILPSKETLRRAYEHCAALYETPLVDSDDLYDEHPHRQRRYYPPDRDTSEYAANEEAPDKDSVLDMQHFLHDTKDSKDLPTKRLRQYVLRWVRWVTSGLAVNETLLNSLQDFLPGVLSNWPPGMQGTSLAH